MRIDSRGLLAKLTYCNKSQKDVSDALGVARSTLWRKLHDESFTIKEVHQLMKIVPLTMEDVEQIFFAD